MIIFPAIDLYGGKAVRLFKGDYAQMTVYHEDPLSVARDFEAKGATHVHLVDLEGARDGSTPHLDLVRRIAQSTSLSTEVGGGIRSMETAEAYLSAGVDRVILGTAAVTDPDFLAQAIARYGDRVAVGVDIKDGYVAIRGWTQTVPYTLLTFCEQMEQAGVRTLICTDISRDGAMRGANRDMYRDITRRCGLRIVASGGVSSLEDVKTLAGMSLYGAIIGKAYYTGAIDLGEAIKEAAV